MEEQHRLTEEVLKKAIANEFSKIEALVEVLEFNVTGKQHMTISTKVGGSMEWIFFGFTGGSNKGDNFACEMKAVAVTAKVDGETKNISYMAKCFPLSDARVKFLKDVSYIV